MRYGRSIQNTIQILQALRLTCFKVVIRKFGEHSLANTPSAYVTVADRLPLMIARLLGSLPPVN